MATNAELVRGFFEQAVNQRDEAALQEFLAPDYVNYTFAAMGYPRGVEGMKAALDLFLSGFPDLRVTVEDVIADGDKVSSRGVMRGTHGGEFMGVPPSGKQMQIEWIDVWQVKNGQLVENWVQIDLLGLMQQIGAVPGGA